MIFTKDLLLKGLAGLAVCTGAVGLGVHYNGGFSSLFGSSEVKITNPQGQLGLPAECTLPAVGGPAVSCNLTNKNINSIKFESTSTDPSITGSGTPQATLEISIPNADEKSDFPHGYKFRLSVPSENTGGVLSINRDATAGGNIVIKAGKSADFKVKKTDNGFALEEAFTLNTLVNKLDDFSCADDGTCQIGSTAISIKQGDHTESKTKATSQSSSPEGKIKVYSGEANYNKGFKFVIQEGDIDLTSDSGNNITKFEQFETYEIKKEGEAWVLVRKHKASEVIKKALGLPTECTMPESSGDVDCLLNDQAKLKEIKFEGKSEGDITVESGDYSTIKLKISKTTNTNKADFSYGFKFVLESDKDITIPQGSNTEITIAKGTNTEFKIKKVGEGKNITLTLERAWSVASLGAKINLTGCTTVGDTKECSSGNTINVYDDATHKVTGATITTGKKITYELDKGGHNQGVKFYIPHTEAADITISGGTTTSGVTAVTTISKETTAGSGPSYEIKEIGGT